MGIAFSFRWQWKVLQLRVSFSCYIYIRYIGVLNLVVHGGRMKIVWCLWLVFGFEPGYWLKHILTLSWLLVENASLGMHSLSCLCKFYCHFFCVIITSGQAMSCCRLDTMDIPTCCTIIFLILALFIPVAVLYDQIGMMHTSNFKRNMHPRQDSGGCY